MPLPSSRPDLTMAAWIGRAAPALAAACAALAAPPLHALQLLDARDGVAVEAIVSIKEPTRIRIEGAPILDVVGNVHSSNCGGAQASPAHGPTAIGSAPTSAVNPAGEFVLECDRDRGEIYVRPVGEGGKPINLFISSAHGTYTLVLRRSDTPADTIVLRDNTVRALPPATGPTSQGPSPNHIRAMKALLVAMALDRAPADVRVEELGVPVQLWAGTRLILVRRFEGRGLIGERYQLENKSPTAMVLAEQEFDREDGQVVGIAIEHHNLRPGEATSVFVIRRGSTR